MIVIRRNGSPSIKVGGRLLQKIPKYALIFELYCSTERMPPIFHVVPRGSGESAACLDGTSVEFTVPVRNHNGNTQVWTKSNLLEVAKELQSRLGPGVDAYLEVR